MTTGGKESSPIHVDPTPFFSSNLTAGRPSFDLPQLAEVFGDGRDEELRAKISALRDSGSNLKQVAEKLSMTPRRASFTMLRLGIPTKMLPKKSYRAQT